MHTYEVIDGSEHQGAVIKINLARTRSKRWGIFGEGELFAPVVSMLYHIGASSFDR